MILTHKTYALATLMLLSFTQFTNAQNLGIGTDFPDANAILDIVSTDKGILIPRLSSGQRGSNLTGLGGGQEGLLIYNTTSSNFNYWNGSNWIPFPGGDADWYESTTVTSPTSIASNIYTNGNVGIGTNSPTQTLHLANSGGAIQSIIIEDMIDGGNAYNPTTAMVGQADRASVIVDKTTGLMYAVDADDIFWRLDGNANVSSAGYTGICPNLISTSMNASGFDFIGTRDNTDFVFATNDIERGRFLRDGQMVFYGKGIGVPASSPTGCVPAYPVIDVASFYGTDTIFALNAYSENAPAVYGATEDAGGNGIPVGVQGYVWENGSGTEGIAEGGSAAYPFGIGVYAQEQSGYGWGLYVSGLAFSSLGVWTPSDANLKKDIKKYDSSLSNLMKLDPVTYAFKTDLARDYTLPQGQQIGFLAQNIEEVFPNLVKNANLRGGHVKKGSGQSRTPNLKGVKTVNYDGLIPVLVGATQEQQDLINKLKAENQAMKKMLKELKSRIEALE